MHGRGCVLVSTEAPRATHLHSEVLKSCTCETSALETVRPLCVTFETSGDGGGTGGLQGGAGRLRPGQTGGSRDPGTHCLPFGYVYHQDCEDP